MVEKIFLQGIAKQATPKEGELYKSVTVSGVTFDLYYGYYEEFERYGKYNEPMPIYPDFIKQPVYNSEGVPFVTAMQNICKHYLGKAGGDGCEECAHFRGCEELFGLCTCEKKQKRKRKAAI